MGQVCIWTEFDNCEGHSNVFHVLYHSFMQLWPGRPNVQIIRDTSCKQLHIIQSRSHLSSVGQDIDFGVIHESYISFLVRCFYNEAGYNFSINKSKVWYVVLARLQFQSEFLIYRKHSVFYDQLKRGCKNNSAIKMIMRYCEVALCFLELHTQSHKYFGFSKIILVQNQELHLSASLYALKGRELFILS